MEYKRIASAAVWEVEELMDDRCYESCGIGVFPISGITTKPIKECRWKSSSRLFDNLAPQYSLAASFNVAKSDHKLDGGQ